MCHKCCAFVAKVRKRRKTVVEGQCARTVLESRWSVINTAIVSVWVGLCGYNNVLRGLQAKRLLKNRYHHHWVTRSSVLGLAVRGFGRIPSWRRRLVAGAAWRR